MRRLLISLHIPKTGGTSFRRTLTEALGPEGLRLDYGHPEGFERLIRDGVPPLELHRRWLDMGYGEALQNYRDVRAGLAPPIVGVHGHFPAVKYMPALASGARFITWVREPLARMASNYRFWQQLGPDGVNDAMANYILKEKWSLEEFCLSPALANYQSRWVQRFPLRLFAFVGVTEFYEAELERLSRTLLARNVIAQPLAFHRLNMSPTPANAAAEARELERLRPAFERLHAADMRLYRYALARRQKALTTS